MIPQIGVPVLLAHEIPEQLLLFPSLQIMHSVCLPPPTPNFIAGDDLILFELLAPKYQAASLERKSLSIIVVGSFYFIFSYKATQKSGN